MPMAGNAAALLPIKRVLVSVTDKRGVVDLCNQLVDINKAKVDFYSTGGTYKVLAAANIPVHEVSEITHFPEILSGRVKTLHPGVHAGLLSIRSNSHHAEEMAKLGLSNWDLLIVNLYQFEQVASDPMQSSRDVIEQIDIGGPAMLRSASKNFADVATISSPDQYSELITELTNNCGCTSLKFRERLAVAAFERTARYDQCIYEYLNSLQPKTGANKSNKGDTFMPCEQFASWQSAIRQYSIQPQQGLKYGLNPYQQPACLCLSAGVADSPFKVLNGQPGYINLLDAVHAWQLVSELQKSLPGSPPVAASFKHVSPAGVAVGRSPLTVTEASYFLLSEDLKKKLELFSDLKERMLPNHQVAAAIVRARNCDPLCSFGDFLAVSGVVDELCATLLKSEISDGIIASGYSSEALQILSAKKSGNYVILKANTEYTPPLFEYREIYGIGLWQRRNDQAALEKFEVQSDNSNAPLTEEILESLMLAAVTLKYTQSNSICFAQSGQAVGVAAGQQSRIDAVQVAARKTRMWQEKINAQVAYIQGSLNLNKYYWDQYFIENQHPEPLTLNEIEEWTSLTSKGGLEDVTSGSFSQNSMHLCAASDGFFPFRDSIDVMAQNGVSWIAHPGGSVSDNIITEAAHSLNIGIMTTGTRLFLH